MLRILFSMIAGVGLLGLVSCSSSSNKQKTDEMKLNGYKIGSYGYDAAFLKANNIDFVELADVNDMAKVMVIPSLQGRVMTSSANGNEGLSFGWINYDLIKSGEKNNQFNPFGGEERFWLGPEGGPFSLYFKEGDEQVFENWAVPAVLDTESYDISQVSSTSVSFEKNTVLKNASGSEFNIGIKRKVSLIGREDLYSMLYVDLPEGFFDVTAYQSENTITNNGENPWVKESGLPSIWLLCMFNPSPETTVFIPYETEAEGTIVNDEYFGKVPSDRLLVDSGTVFFKIDGKYRSKIGIPPARAKNLCGSFDSSTNVLTLLWCSLPEEPADYVNSNWGEQDDPYAGDAINSYNDGPVDGKIMGPFYEIETSSPAASLEPGESLTHVQRVVHIQGEKVELAKIVNSLFDLNLYSIETKFKKN
ncbi:DUF6786 family protein [Sunxiuqinia sp. A32]|uniref:DUF6786 family protein n=1 Tax=Sunxiuqinia sp. A32 TaxID=3461496 RepID=UPI0040468331